MSSVNITDITMATLETRKELFKEWFGKNFKSGDNAEVSVKSLCTIYNLDTNEEANHVHDRHITEVLKTMLPPTDLFRSRRKGVNYNKMVIRNQQYIKGDVPVVMHSEDEKSTSNEVLVIEETKPSVSKNYAFIEEEAPAKTVEKVEKVEKKKPVKKEMIKVDKEEWELYRNFYMAMRTRFTP